MVNKVEVTRPLGFLYEPNKAIIRAHLVEHLASRLRLSKIDHQVAYLTADQLIRSPFVRAWKILEGFPFSLRRLNRRLSELDVGYANIKVRGFPIKPEEFRKKIKFKGDKGKILVLTRVQDQPYMLICESVER